MVPMRLPTLGLLLSLCACPNLGGRTGDSGVLPATDGGGLAGDTSSGATDGAAPAAQTATSSTSPAAASARDSPVV